MYGPLAGDSFSGYGVERTLPALSTKHFCDVSPHAFVLSFYSSLAWNTVYLKIPQHRGLIWEPLAIQQVRRSCKSTRT